MKKVIVISGPTGIGKSKMAFNIPRNLQNIGIKSEIILCDSIQIYKEFDLLANKPPKEYLSQASYNLLGNYSLKNPISASDYAIESRRLINKFLDEGKVPILEGGNGFYLKMLETGQGRIYSDEEQNKLNECKAIANAIIKHDKDFDKTASRLIKLDPSLPESKIYKNDLYRLEKRLSDAILLGRNAYEEITRREEKAKVENRINADFYKFFITRNLQELDDILFQRTNQLLEKGLILEVLDLIDQGLIPCNFNDVINNPVKNTYGIKQSLQLLIDLKELLNKKNLYIKAFSKDGYNLGKERREAYKIYFKFVKDYTKSNQQYTRQQVKWFKNTENKSCIMNLSTEKDHEVISSSIMKIISDSYENYTNILTNSNEEFMSNKVSKSDEKIYYNFNENIVKQNFKKFNFVETIEITSKIINFLHELEKNIKQPKVNNLSNISSVMIEKYLV